MANIVNREGLSDSREIQSGLSEKIPDICRTIYRSLNTFLVSSSKWASLNLGVFSREGGGRMRRKPMPPRPNSLQDIIRRVEFNGPTGVGPWVAIPGLFSMVATSVSSVPGSGSPNITFEGNRGILLKTFLNVQTGEVRTYLAKSFSDDPEGSLIP